MAVTAQRRLQTTTTRRFGSGRETYTIPDLTKIQTESYARFLQYDAPTDKRKDEGLEGVLREIFPIESYDKKLSLDYLRYELGKPRYEPDECRQLRLTYGRPFRIWLRLNKEQPIEEEVYLGDLPIMLGGGEFIINGAERVVVSQLHRSPGIDFVSEVEAGERFRRDFTLAGLTPRLGAALVTPVSGGRGPGAPDYSDLVLAARQRLRRVLDRVGPELGFVLMDVCGFLKGLEAVEQERGWPLRAGKVALKLALGALARAYGLAGTASGPDRSLGIRSWSEGGAPRPRGVSRPVRRGSAPSS